MVSTILTSKPTYHFIGVGGIGMSGLAELLVRQGYRVSGSDLAEGAITRRLAELGVRVHLGHRAENLGGRRRRGPLHRGERGQPGTRRGPGPGA